MKVHLDLETRATTNLLTAGVHKYTLCPDFKVMCLSFAVDDGPVVGLRGLEFTTEGNYDRDNWVRLKELAADKKVVFTAYNATFERLVWARYFVPKFGFPPIPMKRWRCVMASAAYRALPMRLSDCAKAIDSKHLKDDSGSFVMQKMCKPVPEDKVEFFGNWHESEADFQKLIHYCNDDVLAERAIENEIGLLPEPEQKLWELDQKINDRGIQIDQTMAESAVALKTVVEKGINKQMRKLIGFNSSQVAKLTDYLGYKNINALTLTTALAKDTTPPETKKILTLRREFATTSLAKYKAMVKYNINGRVYGQFQYHGASTGRWSGRGIQFQNMPRGSFNEDTVDFDMELACQCIRNRDMDGIEDLFGSEMSNMEVMKSAIRGAIIPKKNHILRVMDFGQIEARVLAWLSGQESVLDGFRDGLDLYKLTAAGIYKKDYEDITKEERFIGKTAMLALGYQGGGKAFFKFLLNMGVYRPLDFCEDVKFKYRAANKKIESYWYTMERAALRAVSLNRHVQVRDKISFKVEGDFLVMYLPSGRKLSYYKPEIINGKITFMGRNYKNNGKWQRVTTYGGCLTENATQAAARCLLSNAMFNLEKAGYTIIITVHDEVVSEDQIIDCDLSLANMKSTMLQLPEWAANLPLAADGFEAKRYRK